MSKQISIIENSTAVGTIQAQDENEDTLSYSVSGAILGVTYTSHNFSYDELNFGAEYTLMDMVYLRGGLTSPMLEEDSMNDGETLFSTNFGAGLKYALYGVNLVVDYTYRGTETFEIVRPFGLVILLSFFFKGSASFEIFLTSLQIFFILS